MNFSYCASLVAVGPELEEGESHHCYYFAPLIDGDFIELGQSAVVAVSLMQCETQQGVLASYWR